MEHQTHYFLALALPAETKELLSKWRELLEPRLPFKSWIHPEDLHITLAFLGGQASFNQITAIKRQMPDIAKQHEKFTLQLNGLGTFGKSDSPRILWAGVEVSESLHALRNDVYEACTDFGFSLDKRPFSPHITMARKWKSDRPFLPSQLTDIVQPNEDKSVFKAEHFVLYQTHLNRTPKYQPLSIFSLS
ncbi:RNA 2',3'-cyclic phosphodiesterase [Bacillus sp. REN16]|uniref:RNA 2',3'-cyclic phosphodiesterase n=1 Tax=Bacillus sp. REN16 TaxID=2887296 RepID=UPI001E478175|nr:RNA 2',3'-cyclic phosphodiesterase [Bacillus sp. REN16]MCC3358006.1 RNA 2',3'-cyclic phosphodiesterase [Bacillus sp. REN16]